LQNWIWSYGIFTYASIRHNLSEGLLRQYLQMGELWRTDSELVAAKERFVAQIPGFLMPAAYGVAKQGSTGLVFGHVNALGAVRPLPAAVLAFVCGYVSTTGVYPIDGSRLQMAVELLTPAEAATQMPHPNLWSWRKLLADSFEESTFLAFFLAYKEDLQSRNLGRQFEELIIGENSH
jgi:hypothetical protein